WAGAASSAPRPVWQLPGEVNLSGPSTPEKPFQGVTRRPHPVFWSYLLPDRRRPLTVNWVVEQVPQLCRSTAWGVALTCDRAGYPQPLNTCGVVKLVVGVGHDQRGAAGA